MQKQTFSTVASADARGDEPVITISTIALDRDRDELVPEGADFANYLKNPTVLFGHDHSSLPVGVTTRLDVVPGRGIRARWKWLKGDPFADRVKNAFDQGVLRAASVGFLPVESESNGRGGRRYTRWELTEWSHVPVGANPEAVRTLKRLGLAGDDDAIVLRLRDEPDDGKVLMIAPGFAAELRRRRSGGDPIPDPAAIRRHIAGTSDVIDVATIKSALVAAVPAIGADVVRAVRPAIGPMVAQELARRRGRVD